jgi:protein-tyrosine phosphatase
MAEAVFRHKVNRAGLADEFEIDSAGTGAWHVGSPPHPGTQAILAEKSIDWKGQRARQIDRSDLEDFDYILTMDDSNLAGVRALGSGHAIVRPLLEYAPESGHTEVPDPYYSGGYPGVYQLIDQATDGLLGTIRRERGL